MNTIYPFSEACERNKQPILNILQNIFQSTTHVLEVGSGTGQHATYFAEHLPQLTWQTSDCDDYIAGLQARVKEAQSRGINNILPPLALNVTKAWPLQQPYDGIFSANTAHIMSWPMVEDFFGGVGKHLTPGGHFCLYGPFNDKGNYTSQSNAAFDQQLRSRGVGSAIRDFEAIRDLAKQHRLVLSENTVMPANNRLLIFSTEK